MKFYYFKLEKVFLIGLVVMLVVVSGCAGAGFPTFKKEDGAELEIPEVVVRGPQRGVVVDFVEGKPSDEIYGDFVVGLALANYGQNMISADLDVWDTSPLEGFEDVSGFGLTVDPAIIEKGKFVKSGLLDYNLGIFNYYGVKHGDKTQFFAKLNYDYQSELETNFCVTNPDVERELSCALEETLSGVKKLGMGSKYDPVTLSSMKKKVVGSGEGMIFLTLDLVIANLGGGDVVDNYFLEDRSREDVVKFDIYGVDENIDFSCTSPDLEGRGNYGGGFGGDVFEDVRLPEEGELQLPFELKLEKGKANVRCTAPVFVEEPLKDVRVRVLIEHGYSYIMSTKQIDVKG